MYIQRSRFLVNWVIDFGDMDYMNIYKWLAAAFISGGLSLLMGLLVGALI